LKQHYRKRPNFERTEGLHVIVRDNDVDKAMRKLKRMVKNAGIVQEIKERQFFVKPSVKKRLAKKAGKKRWLKKVAQMDNEY
tara:strand:+ start:138 stop:383 length:246 start_codon:yes stop_codon:yes gene_type:complete